MNIRKGIIAIVLASFIGIMANPEMLAASNSVAVNEISRVGVVKTTEVVLEPEPVLEVAGEQLAATSSGQSVVSLNERVANFEKQMTPAANAVNEPEEVIATPVDNIQMAGRALEIVKVGSTEVDSGNHVNKYGSKFYWGHNSAAVFRGLYALGVGDTFTMTENGVTTKYRVAKVEIFEKNFETGILQLNGKGNYMLSLINGRYAGVSYDAILMTCYGEAVGTNDSTNRYVIFAKAM